MKKLAFLALLIAIAVPSMASALPAFPGAEGMGAASVGGRGGTLYVVDTLSDDPADGVTFREACTASGPRYVVFSVSGIIDLTSNMIIDDPYITIAGETSPGGIVVSSSQTNINTHDVIVRHMRFRLGQTRVTSINAEQIGDAIEIGAYSTTPSDPPDQYNIIFDHCSFAWGIDETVSVVCNTSDVTFSWCLFGPGCYRSVHAESPHGAGFIAWGKYAINQRITIHHSVFASNSFRNPENNYNSFIDATNNVVFGHETTRTWEITNLSGYSATANAIGCYTRTDHTGSTTYGRTMYIIHYTTDPQAIIYMDGCLDGTRTSQAMDQWSVQEYWYDVTASTDFRRLTPWPTTGYTGDGIAVTPSQMSAEYAGDIAGLAGAWPEDQYDTALKASFSTLAANYTAIDGEDVDTIAEIEALIGTLSGVYPADTDDDGMADAWEVSAFGDLTQTATGDYDSDGYDNIEEYFHYLAASSEYDAPTAVITSPTTGFSTTASTVTVTGTTTKDDALTITGVSVNGTAATSSDGFATWTANVPISVGSVTLTATVTDSEGQTGTDSVTGTRTETPASTGATVKGCAASGGFSG